MANRTDGAAERTTAGRGYRLCLLAGGAALSLAAVPALAQTARPAPARAVAAQDDAYEVDELVVTGGVQRGAVVGDIPPELQLSPRDIRAYGVSSVSELIVALSPQTASGRGGGGRPVILVNGVRVSGFNEVRDLPTEAIARVDILPEEVALKYGYPADQRVINLVLRERFRALTAEAGYQASTQAGGGDTATASANLLRIQQNNRFQLNAKATGQTPLLESERDLAQPRTDAAFRSLVSEQQSLSLNAVLSRSIREGLSATVNGSLDSSNSKGQLGLDPFAPRALLRDTDTFSGHIGATLAGAISTWRWTATGNADRTETDTTTQRALSGTAFTDLSNSVSTSADAELLLNGRLFTLPAGAVSASFTGGLDTLTFESESRRAGVVRHGALSRDTASGKANVDIPLISASGGALSQLGSLSANFNVAVDELSDFGTLTTLGYGLNWSPVSKVRLIASFTDEDGAPTVQELGNPEIVTPGVQAFDFRTGQTVVINRVEGGNRLLDSDNRHVLKLGLNVKPFEDHDLNVRADYVRTTIEDVISAFPTATTQIEAAFPGRFIRDAQGNLLQIDARPVNFDRRETEQLRYGFTFRKSLGPVRPAGGGRQGQGQGRGQGPAGGTAVDGAAPPPGTPEGGPPPGGGGFGGPGGGGPGGFGGPGGGRGFGGGGMRGAGNFQIGLYHTILFKDEITVRPGVPVLDLLNGAAIGNGGGEPRNQLELQSNLSKNGYGVSLNAKWRQGSTVRGSGLAGSEDLEFSGLTTVNLRLFADLGAQPFARRHPFWRAARVSLSVDNLFDARQDVRSASGATPVNYQPDYLDPLGRTVKLSFRKLFF